ncbi:MAG: hypothetical protein ACFFDN_07015 [Candidatus Hodarchaeota archaeon]
MIFNLESLIVLSVIIIALFFFGFSITYKLMPKVIQNLDARGIYGFDVHKQTRPKVPEMGGVGFFAFALIVLILALIASFFFFQEEFIKIIATIGGLFMAFFIGLFDDLKKRKGKGLGAKTKPILCLAIGFPIFSLGGYQTSNYLWITLRDLGMLPILSFEVYHPSLLLPFLGRARLTFVYPLLIFLICTVCANTYNMIDVYNGAMPGIGIISFIIIMGASFLFSSFSGILLSAIFLGILIAYFQYNKYPARVFSGDVGSLTIGAAFAATIIISKTELVGVIVCIPIIMNSFQTLRSFGGFKEHSEVKIKPTVLLSDGKLDISMKKNVPITLAGLVLIKGPLQEQEIVKMFHILTLYSGILALITTILTITL